MASMVEEKVSSDVESSFVKEKLSTSSSSIVEDDVVKSDAVLDEIAAKVGALDFKKSDGEEEDSVEVATEPEDETATIKRQSEIIKKQAETINTLIQQLRIMFDEYNTACQEKEYYEDLSEALIRYIEIYDGSVEIAGDQEEEEEEDNEGDEENISNLISIKDQQTTMTEEGGDSVMVPNSTPEKQQQQPQEPAVADTVKTDEENSTPNKAVGTENISKQEQDEATTTKKPRITNNELIRLNHILLKELIELRNERDLLRESVFFTPEDDDEDSELTEDEDEVHSCQHCSSTEIANNKMADDEEEEYENNNEDDDMQKIKDESAEDTE